MSAEKRGNGIVRITLNLVVASLLSGGIVAAAYAFTAPRIAANRRLMGEEAMHRLIGAADEFVAAGEGGRYEAREKGAVVGYIVPAEGRGYGGTIRMSAAVGLDGRLLGFEILSHSETPGLGDRAADSSFRDRFTGRARGELEVTKTGESGKIDAISGATITSRAVASALERALETLPGAIGGEK